MDKTPDEIVTLKRIIELGNFPTAVEFGNMLLLQPQDIANRQLIFELIAQAEAGRGEITNAFSSLLKSIELYSHSACDMFLQLVDKVLEIGNQNICLEYLSLARKQWSANNRFANKTIDILLMIDRFDDAYQVFNDRRKFSPVIEARFSLLFQQIISKLHDVSFESFELRQIRGGPYNEAPTIISTEWDSVAIQQRISGDLAGKSDTILEILKAQNIQTIISVDSDWGYHELAWMFLSNVTECIFVGCIPLEKKVIAEAAEHFHNSRIIQFYENLTEVIFLQKPIANCAYLVRLNTSLVTYGGYSHLLSLLIKERIILYGNASSLYEIAKSIERTVWIPAMNITTQNSSNSFGIVL